MGWGGKPGCGLLNGQNQQVDSGSGRCSSCYTKKYIPNSVFGNFNCQEHAKNGKRAATKLRGCCERRDSGALEFRFQESLKRFHCKRLA